MIRVLLDTNVVLDALLSRTPWDADAVAIFEANRAGKIEAYLTATTLTGVFYVARRLAGRANAWLAVGACLDQFSILPVGGRELRAAAADTGADFEDNLQAACAGFAGLDAIATRDPRGFVNSAVPALSPSEILSRPGEGDVDP